MLYTSIKWTFLDSIIMKFCTLLLAFFVWFSLPRALLITAIFTECDCDWYGHWGGFSVWHMWPLCSYSWHLRSRCLSFALGRRSCGWMWFVVLLYKGLLVWTWACEICFLAEIRPNYGKKHVKKLNSILKNRHVQTGLRKLRGVSAKVQRERFRSIQSSRLLNYSNAISRRNR